MIEISIHQSAGFLTFCANGHAMYAKKGEPDIVCAGVSVLSCTLYSALLTHNLVQISSIEHGNAQITFILCEKSIQILEIILIGLSALMEQYPECVQIDDTRERPQGG